MIRFYVVTNRVMNFNQGQRENLATIPIGDKFTYLFLVYLNVLR